MPTPEPPHAAPAKLCLRELSSKPAEPPFTLKPNVLVAEAELRPSEIQDLADRLSDRRKLAGNADLRFRVCLELDGRGASALQDLVDKLNELLARVSKALSFR